MSVDPLLSAHQLAELLGVPVNTLYAWKYRGGGPPAYRIGKHLRYREAEVLGWIEAQRAPARADAAPVS